MKNIKLQHYTFLKNAFIISCLLPFESLIHWDLVGICFGLQEVATHLYFPPVVAQLFSTVLTNLPYWAG